MNLTFQKHFALPVLACALASCSLVDLPLNSAAGSGNEQEVRRLLREGAPIDERGSHDVTPLICAARAGHVRIIRTLLRSGANPDLPAGVNNWTPLMHAIHKNQKSSAAALLDGGAGVNTASASGETALMMAAGYGYTDIVQLLLDRGADAYLKTTGGETALTFAVLGANDIDRFTVGSCQTSTVRALLDRAPDLRLRDRLGDRAAKWIANHRGCQDVVALLH